MSLETTIQPRKQNLSMLSVVVLSHNRKSDAERNIRRLAELSRSSYMELIVVDNGSEDGSAEVISEILTDVPRAHFVRHKTNLWVPAGRNSGWRIATGDFILFLDEDIEIGEKQIVDLIRIISTDPTCAAVYPKIVDRNTGSIITVLSDTEVEVSGIFEACFLVKKSVSSIVGMFDETLVFGANGIDLAIRIRAAGRRVRYTPQIAVQHNSLLRTGRLFIDRHITWVRGFSMVHHKYFSSFFAWQLTVRYTFANCLTVARVSGIVACIHLLEAACSGVMAGRRARNPVPHEVERFYRDPELRPDFGNQPIWKKIKRKLFARRSSQ